MWGSKPAILATLLIFVNGCATHQHRADSLKFGFHVVRSQLVEPFNRPVSYVSRIVFLVGDNAIDTPREMVLRTVRIPALDGETAAPLHQGDGMDLTVWENELDKIVGGHRSFGKIELLIDGNEYFPALATAIANAKTSVKLRTYIFDVDDVSLAVADQLKERSADIDVEVMFDGLGTMLAERIVTEAQPVLENKPMSIGSYLKSRSQVRSVVLRDSRPSLDSHRRKPECRQISALDIPSS